jgi:DNA-binding FadR family transcriptional regulator
VKDVLLKQHKDSNIKLSAQIVKKIERRIVMSGWEPGTLLATEAELIQEYGISRAILREALGQLERRGIARMRRGYGGGLMISDSARSATIHSLATYLELANAELGDLFEARMLLDMLSAKLASNNISEDSIALIKAEFAKLDDPDISSEGKAGILLKLRKLFAIASGNPYLSLLMEAIDNSCVDIITFEFGELHIFKDIRKKIVELERALAQAIFDGDELRAQQLAREKNELQIHHYRHHLDRTRAQLHTSNDKSAIPGIKLGHSIALTISHDISERKLQPGDRLGSEPELMEKYGISRAAFREAVRILEAHDIVYARRGSRGGLTVGKLNPTNVIETLILYLGVLDIHYESLIEVRECLELGSLRFAIERIDQNDRQNIHVAITALDKAGTVEENLTRTIDVHRTITNCSHNLTLSLILEATFSFLARAYDSKKLSTEFVRNARDNHQKIAQALTDKNLGLAHREMHKHLAMIKDWWLKQRHRNPVYDDKSLND